MPNKELSIIIVNFKSERFLEKCLSSIYEKINNINFEIIIVNNDKNEKLEAVSEKFPEAKIVHLEKNNGFGAGNNFGAKIAQGNFLFFLNPDAELISGNIKEAISLFKKDKSLGIAGSRLMNMQGTTQDWIAGTETSLVEMIKNKLNISKIKKIWLSDRKVEVGWVTGAALFIRKKLFHSLSGFDENFFMYFEDMDLCKRAKKAGWKIIYYPKIKIRHRGGKSYNFREKKQKKDYYKSQDYFFKKHRGSFEASLVKILRKAVKFK